MEGSYAAGARIPVRHHLWEADLVVGPTAGRLQHGTHGTAASFSAVGDLLWVDWDAYGPEVFVRERGGAAYEAADVRPRGGVPAIDLLARQHAEIAGTVLPVHALAIAVPTGPGSVLVRPATSDALVFDAIFLKGEYDLPMLGPDIDTVVDLGANTGLSSVYLADRCPAARVIAVEPARANLAVLLANAQLRPRITVVPAAIFSRDGMLELQDTEPTGVLMQPWAYRLAEKASGLGSYSVEGIGMATLMQRYGLGTIDLLKVDVEGAEYELFSEGLDAWLPRVNAIAIETHERFRPGVDALVSRALETAFVELDPHGENRVFVRRP